MKTLARRYSKAKANANHVTWTGREALPVPFFCDGLIYDGLEAAVLRIIGSPMVCSGLRLDFRSPAGSGLARMTAALRSGRNEVVPGTTLRIYGSQSNAELIFTRPLPLPTGSVWKVHFDADGDEEFLPQGVTITYYLRHANGPARSDIASRELVEGGIGFWKIGDNFTIA